MTRVIDIRRGNPQMLQNVAMVIHENAVVTEEEKEQNGAKRWYYHAAESMNSTLKVHRVQSWDDINMCSLDLATGTKHHPHESGGVCDKFLR